MIILFLYYIVFTEIRSTTLDYFWVYLASGVFMFNFMMNNIINGAGCILNNVGLVKKIYMLRELIPLGQVLSSFIVELIGYAIIMLFVFGVGYPVKSSVFLLVPLLILNLLCV